MHLVFDLGNSLHKCTVFNGDEIVYQNSSTNRTGNFLKELFRQFPISNAIISSVDTEVAQLATEILTYCSCLVLDSKTPLPIQNLYATPETLGKDRLAGVVGAWAAFPMNNLLVIDAGTCIKYDIITSEAKYLGGAISPGLAMRLKAMHNFTSRLPLIDSPAKEEWQQLSVIGDSTRAAMVSGAWLGAVEEMEGMIRRFNGLYPDLTVLMTGGDADFFELHVKRQIFARPNLVAEGLNTILNYNMNKH